MQHDVKWKRVRTGLWKPVGCAHATAHMGVQDAMPASRMLQEAVKEEEEYQPAVSGSSSSGGGSLAGEDSAEDEEVAGPPAKKKAKKSPLKGSQVKVRGTVPLQSCGP